MLPEPSESGRDLATRVSPGAQPPRMTLSCPALCRAAAFSAAASGPAPRISRLLLARTLPNAAPNTLAQIVRGRALGAHAGCQQRCVGRGQVKTELLDRVADGGADDHPDAAEHSAAARRRVLVGHGVHDAAGHAAAIR